uniref:30S ribosomal protein 3, chloroplastic n=1 Tax=Neogoniolithon spectabile TaxID=231755 RepID=A0A3G3MGL5_9FLOR|nr:putative ribosomal protein 3 [Neogoniolithon spectabile]AYR05978.1 putative ribosomal protein 3 [Neogoniolithon spectabile]
MKKFTLRVILLNTNLGIAIDHVQKVGFSPLTIYFFWPRNDAWQEIKNELRSKPWISENDKIELLNRASQIINYWQEKKASRNEIEQVFSDCNFLQNI